MNQPKMNGTFITFPVISVTKQENGAPLIDRFDINAVAKSIVAINGLDAISEEVTEGGKSTVHFDTSTGMRAIISSAEPHQIMALLDGAQFVSFNVISVAEDERSAEKKIKRFVGFAKPEVIVGVNALDSHYQQVTEDVQSIVYFKPSSGLRPTLSSDTAQSIIDDVNDLATV